MIAFNDYNSTSVSVNKDIEGATAPVFELATKDCTPIKCDQSEFKIFKQRKVKGRRRKVWEEKEREGRCGKKKKEFFKLNVKESEK